MPFQSRSYIKRLTFLCFFMFPLATSIIYIYIYFVGPFGPSISLYFIGSSLKKAHRWNMEVHYSFAPPPTGFVSRLSSEQHHHLHCSQLCHGEGSLMSLAAGYTCLYHVLLLYCLKVQYVKTSHNSCSKCRDCAG